MTKELNLQKHPLSNYLLLALIFCLSAACYDSWVHGSSINSVLFLNFGVPDLMSNLIDQILIATVGASTLIFITTKIKEALIIPFVWLFSMALSKTLLHSSFGYEVQIASQSARYALPLAMYFLLMNKNELGEKILRYSVAVTFIAHGVEAIMLSPIFMDYLFDFSETWFGYELSMSQAKEILYLIGAVDVAVGFIAITTKGKIIIAWIAFWALITAFERILYHGGIIGAVGFFLRAPHWLIPLHLVISELRNISLNFNTARKLPA